MKIIVHGDSEIKMAVAAFEAALLAGAKSVTAERHQEIVVIPVHQVFRSTDCDECQAILRENDCRRANRIVKLQEEYSALEEKLQQTGARLREVIIHG